ncbi:hypothetical protein C2E23DRAFT_262703 [Lenzites betulinus]|nr:hypothetical protein C2E23DRAFT_262703 [Lenzites betulinus]
MCTRIYTNGTYEAWRTVEIRKAARQVRYTFASPTTRGRAVVAHTPRGDAYEARLPFPGTCTRGISARGMRAMLRGSTYPSLFFPTEARSAWHSSPRLLPRQAHELNNAHRNGLGHVRRSRARRRRLRRDIASSPRGTCRGIISKPHTPAARLEPNAPTLPSIPISSLCARARHALSLCRRRALRHRTSVPPIPASGSRRSPRLQIYPLNIRRSNTESRKYDVPALPAAPRAASGAEAEAAAGTAAAPGERPSSPRAPRCCCSWQRKRRLRSCSYPTRA